MEKKTKIPKNSETLPIPAVDITEYTIEGINGDIPCRIYEPHIKGGDYDPVIMGPGFGASIDIQDGLAETICARAGTRVVTLNHPVGGKKDTTLIYESPIINNEDIDDTITIRAANLIDMIDAVVGDHPSQKVMLNGHSMDAISVLVAAAARPENVSGIVLMNPAGLVGKGSSLKLARDFSKDALGIRYWRYPRKVKTYVKGFASYVGKNARDIPSQTHAMAHSDTRDLVRYLGENGIPISVIMSEKDRTFPAVKIRETLGPIVAGNQADEQLGVELLTFTGEKANHGEPLFRPSAAELVADTVAQMRGLEIVRPYYEERARRLGDAAVSKE